jgi:fructokinase
VNTRYISEFESGKTAISIAFLNQKKDAEYSFYKSYPEKRLNLPMPVLTSKDYLLFGSFFSLQKEIREPLIRFVRKSAGKDALILYDPNIRSPHKDQIAELLPYIEENISLADIIRASDEDFRTIFNIEKPDEAYREVRKTGCNILILTSSNKGVYLFTPEMKKFYNAREIDPVSTVGAGDSFNAGLLYSLYQDNIRKRELINYHTINWHKIINHGVDFATNVCLSEENYISTSFAETLNI